MSKRKVIIAITGASGQIYAKRLLEKLVEYNSEIDELAICFSDTGMEVYNYEVGNFSSTGNIKLYDNKDFYSPIASGSSNFDSMVIIPCSMGTVGRIASGISNDLITRAADVILKENMKLILVTRETPLNSIHLKNLYKLSNAGAVILPASPSFYNKPVDILELIDTVVDRVIKMLGFKNPAKEWGGN